MALPFRGFRGGAQFSTDVHRTRLPGPAHTLSGRVERPARHGKRFASGNESGFGKQARNPVASRSTQSADSIMSGTSCDTDLHSVRLPKMCSDFAFENALPLLVIRSSRI